MNTPLTQNLDAKSKKLEIASKIKLRINELKNKVEKVVAGEYPADGSICLGNGAGDLSNVTSSQIGFDFNKQIVTSDEIYCSWISLMYSIGLSGGVDIFIKDELILEHIVNGWEYYRKYLDGDFNNKGKQLATWNCLWVSYGYKYKDNPERAYHEILKKRDSKKLYGTVGEGADKGYIELKRCVWTDTIFNLAKHRGELNEYVYGFSFGQQNKTYGLFKVKMDEIQKIHEAWKYLIDRFTPEINSALEESYISKYNIPSAIENGGIGIKTIEPKDIDYAKKKYSESDIKKSFTKQSWLIAMIHNQKLTEASEKLAKLLSENKKKRTAIKSQIFDSRINKGTLIRNLTDIYIDEMPPALFEVIEIIDSEEMIKDQYFYFLDITRARFFYYINN